jgi:hypothetical protein
MTASTGMTGSISTDSIQGRESMGISFFSGRLQPPFLHFPAVRVTAPAIIRTSTKKTCFKYGTGGMICAENAAQKKKEQEETRMNIPENILSTLTDEQKQKVRLQRHRRSFFPWQKKPVMN